MLTLPDLIVKGLRSIPGEHYVEGRVHQGFEDVIHAALDAPGGAIHTVQTAIGSPSKLDDLIIEMGKQTLTDLRHPLRHPGYTALDILGIIPTPIAGVARGIRIAQMASLAGKVSRGADAATALRLAADAGHMPEYLTNAANAAKVGKSKEYNRLVNPDTGQINPRAKLMRDALLYGAPREERLLSRSRDPNALFPEGAEALDQADTLVQHGWWYSKDPTIKAAQKLVDKVYDHFPEHKIPPIWRVAGAPLFWKTQQMRLHSAARADILANAKEAKGRGAAYLAEHAHLFDDINEETVRVIGEGTPIAERIKMHQNALASGKLSPKQVVETQDMIQRILPAVAQRVEERKHVSEATGNEHTYMALKPEYEQELGKFVADSREIAKDREWASEHAGVLNNTSKVRRLVAPYIFAKTGVLPLDISYLKRRLAGFEGAGNTKRAQEMRALIEEQTGMDQLNLLDDDPQVSLARVFADEADAAKFAEAAGLFRVPYGVQRDSFTRFGEPFRRSYRGGKPRVPGSYTHAFTAELMKTGGGDRRVARLLAESYTEAQRYLALRAVRDRLLATAQDTPVGIPVKQRQLIRTDDFGLPHMMSAKQAERAARVTDSPKVLEKEAGDLTPQEAVAAGRLYEGMRGDLFPTMRGLRRDDVHLGDDPGIAANAWESIRAAIRGEDEKFTPIPGYKWIDKSQLGDLHKRNPLVAAADYPVVGKAIQTLDQLNSSIKTLMLFVRPSYIGPNALSNIALNLIQTGAFFPAHMARNYWTWKHLKPETKKRMLTQVGEGTAALAFERGGKRRLSPQRVEHAFARGYGLIVDRNFRLNAFLQEAAESGFDDAGKVNKLFDDSAYSKQLSQITNVANDAIITYDRLGPAEEALLRRLILFYPFTKGASRYAANFAKTHPTAASASGVLGQYSANRTEEILGEKPAWAAGIFPYTEGGPGFPQVGNPASLSILGEPAHVLEMTANLIRGNPNPNLAFSESLTPAMTSLMNLFTSGKTAPIAHESGRSLATTSLEDLYRGLPPFTLYNRLRGRSSLGGDVESSVYPDDRKRAALLQFLITSGLQPRYWNPDIGQSMAYDESIGRG